MKTESKMQTGRDPYFDNAKGILIGLVVLAHALVPLLDVSRASRAAYMVVAVIFPAFIAVAGYFAKNLTRPDRNLRIIERSLIPYLIFQFLFLAVDWGFGDHRAGTETMVHPYWMMWFMCAWFIWQVLLPVAAKIPHIIPIAFALSILAGYTSEIGTFLALSKTVFYFPFFLLGFFLEPKHLTALRHPRVRASAAVILGLVIVGCWFVAKWNVQEWFLVNSHYAGLGHPEWWAGVYRVLLQIAGLVGGAALLALAPSTPNGMLTKLGTRTLYVYLLHGFFVRGLTGVGAYRALHGPVREVFPYALAIVLTLVLGTPAVARVCRPLVEVRLRRQPSEA